ncbi:MAG: aminoacetone oxidase family FAD-binding enzyme [Emergencia timonensis]|uniref:aminoacetone oxidase family FAD-binding enzyme n=1 Tax=Emergencia timonensis TaxID=1776384 RepID=UPI000835F480|nr:aminoacetone oxidase family FAD-binding enzyme [Emergencia timonensis]WNX89817.1 aminoacetone oxidase family FAD-binding enzyme [Emergencia timonensis]
MIDICIIGGGAAGMTAAICAKEKNPSLDVLIIEKKEQMGKKILASGNGKCNLTNIKCQNYRQTLAFFAHLGLLTRTDEEGRVYPYTEEARAVYTAMEKRIGILGIRTETSSQVLAVDKKEHFQIHTAKDCFEARKLLIACGGKAGPQFGTTGDGSKLAKQLGHHVTRLVPVLTAIDVKEDNRDLAGIRVKACVSLCHRGEIIAEETGELQFTKTGVSGICVFNLSRFLLLPQGKTIKDGFDDYRILIDFFPGKGNLTEVLLERSQMKGFEREHLLDFLVRGPIAERIYQLSKGDIKEMARLLRHFPLSPKGAKGWDYAQVTKGGVCLDEIDLTAMESKITKDLYFAGEVVDYDGPCGGYNLQYAFETGMLAGKEMANE